MDISIIVCTRNRAQSLGRFLDSALCLRVPHGVKWELLIVDNGSADGTEGVIRSYHDRLPVRYVSEPTAGLSIARNRGVSEANGGLICWTDDDVVLDPDYLTAYWEAWRAHPDASFFAGRITPVLEEPVQPWFEKLRHSWVLASVMAQRDFVQPAAPIKTDNDFLPFGANFAIVSKVQQVYIYDPELGLSPTHKRIGEETAVILSILADSGTGWTVPRANVFHQISISRQSSAYIEEYFRASGETWAYLSGTDQHPNFLGPPLRGRFRVLGVPIWLWHLSCREWIAMRWHRVFGRSDRWLVATAIGARHLGALRFLLKQHRHATPVKERGVHNV